MRHQAFGETKRSILDKIIAFVRLAKVQKALGSGGAILDLGCGYNGDLLSELGSSFEAHGVDLSVNPKKKHLVKGRVDQVLPFADESFEIVTALAIIEHVNDPAMMIQEAVRVLKPGGRVIITTPSALGRIPLEMMARIGLISNTEIEDHKRYYTRASLKALLRRFELSEVEVQHFGIMWLNLFAKAKK